MGFVPENYIQLTNGDVIDQNEINVDADDVQVTSATTAAAAMTSTTTANGHVQPQRTDTMGSGASNYSATDYEVQRTVNCQPTVPGKKRK